MKRPKIPLIIIIGAFLLCIFYLEMLPSIIYHQHIEDCKEGESFQQHSFIFKKGECVKSAKTEFCEQVLNCLNSSLYQHQCDSPIPFEGE